MEPPALLVDDEPNILSALKRLFRGKGWHVRSAAGGQAGLALMKSEAVDLVISDMRMPEMDGAQFLAQVRVRWPDTVRLLLTDHSDINAIIEAIIEAINRGEIYRYITKPWDDNDIVLIVHQALEPVWRPKLRRAPPSSGLPTSSSKAPMSDSKPTLSPRSRCSLP